MVGGSPGYKQFNTSSRNLDSDHNIYPHKPSEGNVDSAFLSWPAALLACW